MLIDEILNYACQSYKGKSACTNCTNPGNCPGECNNCLEQVHWPDKYPNGKKDYDCKELIDYYSCSFLYQYASEIYYLLNESQTLKQMNGYRVLSLGCGPSPDLVAFETFVSAMVGKSIQYCGFDINTLWKPLHNHIKPYLSPVIQNIHYDYFDVVELFKQTPVDKANVLVMQYIISHFYNTGQIQSIDTLFDNLIENVILKRKDQEPFVILINDVNSNKKGRDFFTDLIPKLQIKGLNARYLPFYFDHGNLYDFQRYGTKHPSNAVVFHPSTLLQRRCNPRTNGCRSAQLLIEVN